MTIPRIDGLDRNYYINGNFEYWQRAGSTSLTVTNSFQYWMDRWAIEMGGTWTTPQCQRSTDVPSIKSKYSCEVTGTLTNIADNMVYRQRMESAFSRNLVNKVISISMKVKSDNMKQVRLRLASPTVEDDFSILDATFVDTTQAFTDDSTWQEIVFENITIPSSVVRGLDTKISVQDATGLVATNIKIGEIKISIGTKAQNFSLAGRDVVEELQLCQRYFEKSYDLDTIPGTITNTGQRMASSSATNYNESTDFMVSKRSISIVTNYSDATGAAGFVRNATGGTDISSAAGTIGINRYRNAAGGFFSDGQITWHFTADAEL